MPLSSLCFVEGSIDGLSTVSTHSLCSNLKAVTRPLNIKHSKVAFKDDENLCQKLFNDYTVPLMHEVKNRDLCNVYWINNLRVSDTTSREL